MSTDATDDIAGSGRFAFRRSTGRCGAKRVGPDGVEQPCLLAPHGGGNHKWTMQRKPREASGELAALRERHTTLLSAVREWVEAKHAREEHPPFSRMKLVMDIEEWDAELTARMDREAAAESTLRSLAQENGT